MASEDLGALGSTAVTVRADTSQLPGDFNKAESMAKSFALRVKAAINISDTAESFAGYAKFVPIAPVRELGKAVEAVTSPVNTLAKGFTSVGGAIALVGIFASGSVGKIARLASAAITVVGVTAKLAGVAIGVTAAFAGLFLKLGAIATAVTSIVISLSAKLVEGVAKALADVVTVVADIVSGVAQAVGAVVGTAVKAIGAVIEQAVGAIVGLGKVLVALVGAAGAASYALYKVVSVASDLNETMSKTKEVFGSATSVVTRAANQMAKAFGVPKTEFLDAASSLGLVAKASGYTQTEAARLSVKLAKLAVDASSFYNVPLTEALIAMRAGLVGEAEPMRRFGVLLDEASVANKALAMGLANTKEELTQGSKVQARAALIMAGMATASGDLARTQDSFANRTREIGGRLQSLFATIGEMFMPAAKAVAGTLSQITKDLEAFVKNNGDQIEAFASKIGDIAGVLGNVFKDWPTYLEVAGEIGKDAFGKLQVVLGRLATIAGNVGAMVVDAFKSVFAQVASIWSANSETIQKQAGVIFDEIGKKIQETLSTSIAKGVELGLKGASALLPSLEGVIGKVLKAINPFESTSFKKIIAGSSMSNAGYFGGAIGIPMAARAILPKPVKPEEESKLGFFGDMANNLNHSLRGTHPDWWHKKQAPLRERWKQQNPGKELGENDELKEGRDGYVGLLQQSSLGFGGGAGGSEKANKTPGLAPNRLVDLSRIQEIAKLAEAEKKTTLNLADFGRKLMDQLPTLDKVQSAFANAADAMSGKFSRDKLTAGLPEGGLFGSLPSNPGVATAMAKLQSNSVDSGIKDAKSGLADRFTNFATDLRGTLKERQAAAKLRTPNTLQAVNKRNKNLARSDRVSSSLQEDRDQAYSDKLSMQYTRGPAQRWLAQLPERAKAQSAFGPPQILAGTGRDNWGMPTAPKHIQTQENKWIAGLNKESSAFDARRNAKRDAARTASQKAENFVGPVAPDRFKPQPADARTLSNKQAARLASGRSRVQALRARRGGGNQSLSSGAGGGLFSALIGQGLNAAGKAAKKLGATKTSDALKGAATGIGPKKPDLKAVKGGRGRHRYARPGGPGATQEPESTEPFQSQWSGVQDFTRQIQTTALSRGGGDSADKTAKNTDDMNQLWQNWKTSGVPVQIKSGSVPGTASGPE